MIKWIVSDLDGTLFDGHGETVLDLSAENEAALREIQQAGIEFSTASGRMIGYSIHLMKKYGFSKIRAAGFNGAVGYDQGKWVAVRALKRETLGQIIQLLRSECPQLETLQIQGMNSERIFTSLDHPAALRYRQECAKTGIGQVMDFTVDQYLERDRGLLAGKLSAQFNSPAACQAVYHRLSHQFHDQCLIHRSGDRLLEIGNCLAHKGLFLAYLKETYQLQPQEMAVIGDSLNDAEMFSEAQHTFAMKSGSEELQRLAAHTVDSAAQAMRWCIAYNQNEQRERENLFSAKA